MVVHAALLDEILNLSFITTAGKFVVELQLFHGSHPPLHLVQLYLSGREHRLNCGLGVLILLEKASQLKFLVQLFPSCHYLVGMIILLP